MTETKSIAAPVTLKLGRRTYELPSVEAAQVLFAKSRDVAFERGVNPNALPKAILMRDGEAFGYISQNGRAWPGNSLDWTPERRPMRDFCNSTMQSREVA